MHCPMLLLHDRPSAVNRIIMDSTNQIRPDHRGWIQFTCNHIYSANFQGESRLAIHAQALQVYWSYRDYTSRSSCFRAQVPLMFSIQRCNAIKRTLYEIKYPRHEGVSLNRAGTNHKIPLIPSPPPLHLDYVLVLLRPR
jgi:hypothetical protein